MDFNVYINGVSDVDFLRVVSWKIRPFAILLDPPDWTVGVSSVTDCVRQVFVHDANYALQIVPSWHVLKHLLYSTEINVLGLYVSQLTTNRRHGLPRQQKHSK